MQIIKVIGAILGAALLFLLGILVGEKGKSKEVRKQVKCSIKKLTTAFKEQQNKDKAAFDETIYDKNKTIEELTSIIEEFKDALQKQNKDGIPFIDTMCGMKFNSVLEKQSMKLLAIAQK
jgi:septal ring factor EnvC (AmiA/AmiB activator)